jgi:hypothetical protein
MAVARLLANPALHAIFTLILSALHTRDVACRKNPERIDHMDTGHLSARPRAGRRTWRTSSPSLPDVPGLLATLQFPGLPPDAADRISQALAAESLDRAAAATARETRAPIWVPRPRTGKELPPLTRVIPRPRQPSAAV